MRLCFSSPVGNILLESDDDKLKSLIFIDYFLETEGDKLLLNCKDEILDFLSGKVKKIKCKVDLQGTEFRQKVWAELLKIPYGETVSYKYIAKKINNPKAVRAVANAIGKNPISIIVPCHRVIGSNGKLTGYRFGLEIKSKLLEIERDFKN